MKKKTTIPYPKILLGLTLCIMAVVMLVKFMPGILELMKNPKALAEYLKTFGYSGFLIFLLLEILQVVLAFVPGDIFHIAAGFVYHMPLGFLLAYTGECIGALLAFHLAKFFGSDIVKKYIGNDKIQKLCQLINSGQGIFGVFVLCLIPAIPKDILLYVAGITPIKAARFLIVFLLCRIPDIFIKSSSGAALYQEDYVSLIIIIAAFLLFVGIGWLLKKKFIKTEA